MAYTYTTVDSTIGTSGRDYATVALWNAAVPANLTAANCSHRGIMYADSVFNESTNISAHTVDLLHFMLLTAAPGQEYNGIEGAGVVWRGPVNTYLCLALAGFGQHVYGIEFDGQDTSGDANYGLITGFNFTRCGIHNSKDHGSVMGSNNGESRVANIYYDNAQYGLRGAGAGGYGNAVVHCGFYRNGLDGFHATAPYAEQMTVLNCWGYSNGGSAILNATNPQFCSVDDTSIADDGTNLLSQLIGDAKFTDAPNGNFSLQAGSSLLQKGVFLAGSNLGFAYIANGFTYNAIDIKGTKFAAGFGQQADIGPEQYSYKPVTPATYATIKIPIDIRTAEIAPVNAYWEVMSLSNGFDLGYWKCTKDVDGKVYGLVSIPENYYSGGKVYLTTAYPNPNYSSSSTSSATSSGSTATSATTETTSSSSQSSSSGSSSSTSLSSSSTSSASTSGSSASTASTATSESSSSEAEKSVWQVNYELTSNLDSFNQALTSITKQSLSVPDTAYERTDSSGFILTSPVAGDELLVELVHLGTDAGDNCSVDSLLIDAYLEVTVTTS